jgi:membrane protease YdiL (CAAX protease family)
MLHLGVAKVFQISAPLLLLGVSKRDIQMQVVVANGWWLLGAIASLLVWPAAMRWCMAPDCRNVFRVFDIRAASFRDWRWWLFGIAGSGLLYLAFVGLALAMQWVGIDEAMTDYLSRSFKALGSAALPVMILLATLLAPWVEELVHRGFLFTAMRNQFGPWLGATISSTIFALGHLYSNQGTMIVFLCGMVLCYVYQRSNSLVPGMILHACFNLPLFVLKWLQWSA